MEGSRSGQCDAVSLPEECFTFELLHNPLNKAYMIWSMPLILTPLYVKLIKTIYASNCLM